MGSTLTDLSMRLLMPFSFDNIKELAFKTDPSISKIEIKSFLESMHGLEVKRVQTLNMQGKKKRRGGQLIARPKYKKAYVTLKNPLSLPSGIVPSHAIETEKNIMSGSSSINKEGEENLLSFVTRRISR